MDQLEIVELGNLKGVVRMRLRGPLDARNTHALLQRCGDVLEARRHLILGLADVTLLSSSGIGVLLAMNEDFKGQGLSLRLANPSAPVRTAIELLNLTSFLRLTPSEEEALRDLAA